MPDQLTKEGLTLKNLTEIRDEMVLGLKEVYGQDINTGITTADGQMITIFAQACIDSREIIKSMYDSFDVFQAEGVVLDQRVALGGIKRKGASFTFASIQVDIDKEVRLQGLDLERGTVSPAVPNLFTVKDNTGTEYYLMDTITLTLGSPNGSPSPDSTVDKPITRFSLNFRAAEIGKVETLANTINGVVTIIAGVVKINNGNKAPVVGLNEETDEQLKVRFARSSSLPAQGYLEGIQSSIEALPKVDLAKVYENDTDLTNSDGQPPHSVWVVIKGTPALADDPDYDPRDTGLSVSEVLYSKVPAGVGIYAAPNTEGNGIFHEEKVIRSNGQFFIGRWNEAQDRDLYIKMTVHFRKNLYALKEILTLDVQNREKLKQSMIGEGGGDYLRWNLGESAGSDDIIHFLKEKHPEYRVSNVYISLTDNWDTDSRQLIESEKYQTFVVAKDRIVIV